jgi:hypothetical protein
MTLANEKFQRGTSVPHYPDANFRKGKSTLITERSSVGTSVLHYPEVDFQKVEATLTTPRPPVGLSVTRDPQACDLKNQLMKELKLKLESRKQSQAQSLPADVPLASNASTFKTPDRGVPSGNMANFQVLHVQLDNTKTNLEQGQEPCITEHDLQKGQGKNLPSAAKFTSHSVLKTGEFGGGDARFETSQPRRKSCYPQDRASEKIHESKSSSTLSLKGQPPPENCFKNQMKYFLQWLCPGTRGKGQGSSMGKGSSPSSSVQGRGLGKGRAAFTGNSKDEKDTKGFTKFLGEKSRRDAVDGTCPQGPLLSSTKPGKTQTKAKLQVQHKADPVQGHHFTHKASCSKVLCAQSCKQECAFSDLSYLKRNKQIREGGGKPPTSVPFKEQRRAPPLPNREPVPQPSSTSRPQERQVPLAATTILEGTRLAKFSPMLKDNIVLQHFKGGKFPSPK